MGNTERDELAPAAEASAPSTPMTLQLYRNMMEFVLKPDNPVREACFQEAQRMLSDFAPRDAVEEMLAAQLLWTHGRLAHLSFYAVVQTKSGKNIQLFHELANKTLNASRRLIETLILYRHPHGRRFVAVRQANIAQHQVVQNARRGKKKRPRLGGASKRRLKENHVQRIEATVSAGAAAPGLPAVAAGPGFPAPAHPPDQAMGEEHGPQDDFGEVCLWPKLG